MKAYRIVDRSKSQLLRDFLAKNGQVLLPMLKLIEGSRITIDELVDGLVRPASKRCCSCRSRSVADEAAGPLAKLIPIPVGGDYGREDDPLAELKADIRTDRGRALVLETTAAG